MGIQNYLKKQGYSTKFNTYKKNNGKSVEFLDLGTYVTLVGKGCKTDQKAPNTLLYLSCMKKSSLFIVWAMVWTMDMSGFA